MQTDKNTILVPGTKFSSGFKGTASELKDPSSSREVAPEKIKSEAEIEKEEVQKEIRRIAASPELFQGTILFCQSMKRIMDRAAESGKEFVEERRCPSCSKPRR